MFNGNGIFWKEMRYLGGSGSPTDGSFFLNTIHAFLLMIHLSNLFGLVQPIHYRIFSFDDMN